MKKAYFILCFSFAFLNTEAKIWTVSNVSGAVAMYTDIQPAIDAASVGDTVFVHASPNRYNNNSSQYSIKKRIVLLGEGTGTYAYNFVIDSLAGQPVSGLVINGFVLDYLTNSNTSVKGIVVTNSYVANTADMDGVGYIIVKNVFPSYVNLGTNSIFSNNIVGTYLSNGSNNVISNNIFVAGYSTGCIRSVTNCSITNNIFLATYPVVYQGTNNTFSKNIQGGTDLPSGNQTGITVSPAGAVASVVFSETAINTAMNSGTYHQYYWSQKATSPAKNAGTDGKDLGIYGGSYPWSNTKLFDGDPGLPKVTLVEVQNAVLAPGSTLKLNIKAKSASTK